MKPKERKKLKQTVLNERTKALAQNDSNYNDPKHFFFSIDCCWKTLHLFDFNRGLSLMVHMHLLFIRLIDVVCRSSLPSLSFVCYAIFCVPHFSIVYIEIWHKAQNCSRIPNVRTGKKSSNLVHLQLHKKTSLLTKIEMLPLPNAIRVAKITF